MTYWATSTRFALPVLAVTLLLFVPAEQLTAQSRAALVIGNQTYTGLTQLRNPVNDARDVADSLRSLDFEVDLLVDAPLADMEQAVLRLGSRLSGSAEAVGFFYYAGHGVQSGGANYLVPADAQIPGEAFLKSKALPVQAVLDTVQGSGNKLNVIVLDACRDNPFSWARSWTRGLLVVGQQPPGSIIVYATSAGATALDGEGRNGVFTGELLRHLRAESADIQEVLRRTGAGVRAATGGAQIPAIYSQFFDKYYLARPAEAAIMAATTAGGVMTVDAGTGTLRVQMTSAGRVYVDGVDKGELPAGHTGTIEGVAPGARTVEARYLNGSAENRAVTVVGDQTVTVKFSYLPPVQEAAAVFAPLQMVPIDGGAFQMGGFVPFRDSDQEPAHGATVSRFLMAKTEVILSQYDPFCDETGRTRPSDQGWGRGSRPVINVSWFDAAEFCNWLSRKEGLTPFYIVNGTDVSMNWAANGYRLPTEAEWEYAARGGNRTRGTPYSGSANAGEVAWYSANAGGKTQPVGTKAANELGMYDMSGNVSEWCNDWYARYEVFSQTDPRGPESGSYRAIRGGSWLREALGVSHRFNAEPTHGGLDIGFRPVRALE